MRNANHVTQSALSRRIQFKFWLDVMKDQELWLADELSRLKAARQYSAAIRDGLRLIIDLRAGRVDVLLLLFPFVAAALGAPAASVPAAPIAVPSAVVSRAPAARPDDPPLVVVTDSRQKKASAADVSRNMFAAATAAGWD